MGPAQGKYIPLPPASTPSRTFSTPPTSAWPVWVAPATSGRLRCRKLRPRRRLLETPPPPPRLSIKFASLCVPGYPAGSGSARWDAEAWKGVSKDEITKALANAEIRVLICTDAASEGLNLQAAGAVINYDLPWNSSRVEQRIGRIDRIGQKRSEVKIVNLFLEDSVDDQVYRVLRARCGLFERFVGAMQPVLAFARGMLMGTTAPKAAALQQAAAAVQRDPLAEETYFASPAEDSGSEAAPVTREQMVRALDSISAEFLPGFKPLKKSGVYAVPTESRRVRVTTSVEALEHDSSLVPLTPLGPPVDTLAGQLTRPGERLPLVVGSYQKGAFRQAVAYWVAGGEATQLQSFDELLHKLEEWDGEYPDRTVGRCARKGSTRG